MRLYRDFRLIFEGTSIWVSETIVDITEFIYSISHSIPYWNCALEINLTLKWGHRGPCIILTIIYLFIILPIA